VTSELVAQGYVDHGPAHAGTVSEPPRGVIWTDRDLYLYRDFRVTALGREEADRSHQRRRAERTDAALGLAEAPLGSVAAAHGQSLNGHIRSLQAALDGDHYVAAIGAAKDLVEAACKVKLERRGEEIPRNLTLPQLFKAASGDERLELGRALSTTVQKLAELRNSAGAGHGHAQLPDSAARDARLAAGSAVALVRHLLDEDEDEDEEV
jgi:hypothetical protein